MMRKNHAPSLVCLSLWGTMARILKCIFANVNSIVSRHRRHYLNLFLSEHKPDVMLLAEHCLSPRHKLDIRGYTLYRRNRQNGRGRGTAVLVRDNIYSEEILLDTGEIECTAVRIRGVNGNFTIFISMYLAPNKTFDSSYFGRIRELATEGSIVIGGDLNARHPYWGDPYTNRSGTNLREFLLMCPDLDIQRTEGPTRINAVLSSYIDFFLTTVDITTVSGDRLRTLDYESDHRAVEIVFQTSELMDRERPVIYDYDHIDVRKFRTVLNRKLADHVLPIDRNVSEGDIDSCIDSMNMAFVQAMDQSIPKIAVGAKGLRRLPQNILDFIAHKKRLKRTLHRCEEPGRRNILKADIRNLDKIIQGSISVFERDRWTDYLGRIRMNNRTYRNIKAAAGISSRPPIGNLKDSTGGMISDDPGKANLLADSLFQVWQSGPDHRDDGFASTIRNAISPLGGLPPLTRFGETISAGGRSDNRTFGGISFVDSGKVGEALRNRSNKRSSGVDRIPDFVLRKTDSATWEFLCILFNHCLNLGYFPRAWKEAIVVPILKPGSDPGQCGSYRPISLLSAVGKLFEYFVLGMINDWMFESDILKDFQFGFRQGLSTSHALMVLTDYIAKGLYKRCPTMAVGLDFTKAFDTVWHEGIVFKLMDLGLDPGICRIVQSFLNERTYRVRVNNSLSDGKPVSAGVPQGSLLGPVLYNIFVTDIPQPPEGILLLAYADDILIASTGARARNVNRNMNNYLNVLNDYFVKWGLRLNMDKTVAMIVKGRRKFIYPNWRQFEPCLRLGDGQVRTSDRMKYLGVIIHENFEYYRHVDYILEKAKKIYSAYQRILRQTGGLDERIRLLLYRQVIRPIISYAFPCWFGISSCQMERLRRWERGVLAACMGMRPRIGPDGVPRRPSCLSIYRAIDFGRIDVFMVEMALRFLERASSSDNLLVRECFNGERNLETVQMSRYLSPVDLITLREAGLLYGDTDLLFYHRRINSLDISDTVYNTAQ